MPKTPRVDVRQLFVCQEGKQVPHKILPVNFSTGNKGCPFFLFKEIEKKLVDKETVKEGLYNAVFF